jgi:hypothetical protein
MLTDSPIEAILAIPELAEAILLYLTRAQIQLLRQVSRAWWQLCEPYFYLHYHVKIGGSLLHLASPAFEQDEQGEEEEEEDEDDLTSLASTMTAKRARIRQRQCIRSITLWSYQDDPIGLLGRYCSNSLVKLILMDATRQDLETLAQVLPRLTELRTLEVRPTARDAGADVLLCALSKMLSKRLESFKFGLRRLGMIGLRFSTLVDFLKSATGLKNLSLGTIDFLSENNEDGTTTNPDHQVEHHDNIRQRILSSALATEPRRQSPGPFTHVRQLQLGNSVMSRSQVMDFMCMLPNLSTIDLRFGLGSWSPLFLDSLMATGLVLFPTLRRLNLTWYTGIEHIVLAWFLEASPNLQYLSLAGQWEESDVSSGLPKMTEVFQRTRIRLRGLKFLWFDEQSEGTTDLMAFLNSEGCQDLEEIELFQNPSFVQDILYAREMELERGRQQQEQLSTSSSSRGSEETITSALPQDQQHWFRFSRSLTSLQLTGYHGTTASLDLTRALNKFLRQLPRLVDLSITACFQSYTLFEGLGNCPGAESGGHEKDSFRKSWLGERPFLQTLAIRFEDGFRIVPEEFQREIIDRFRFLDTVQLVAEVKQDDSETFEQWRRRLRPGLRLRFLWESEYHCEQLFL